MEQVSPVVNSSLVSGLWACAVTSCLTVQRQTNNYINFSILPCSYIRILDVVKASQICCHHQHNHHHYHHHRHEHLKFRFIKVCFFRFRRCSRCFHLCFGLPRSQRPLVWYYKASSDKRYFFLATFPPFTLVQYDAFGCAGCLQLFAIASCFLVCQGWWNLKVVLQTSSNRIRFFYIFYVNPIHLALI